MATRDVVLTEHMEQLINDLVLSGRYQNASEVMHEGLRLLEKQEAGKSAKLQALRDAASQGLRDIEQGRFVTVTDDELDAFIDAIGEDAAKAVAENR